MQIWRRHPAAVLAAMVTGAALAVHAWRAVATGCYVDFVTGVWLALADDVRHGVFYRPLIGPDGYGGTRYFPLFFTLIGAAMRAGADPLAAGFLVSLSSGALLVVGLRRMLARIGLPSALAWSLALFVFAPGFTQQALLAIKSDILAGALVVWGLFWAWPAFDEEHPAPSYLLAAGACFALAAATKVTSLYAPAAVVLALALAGRRRSALRLGAIAGAATAAAILGTIAASSGRALESWQACALAGSGVLEWLQAMPSVLMTQVILPSRAFAVVLAAAAGAWLTLLVGKGHRLPLVLFPAALFATLVVLASPGTSYTNQLVELFTVCVIVAGWALARHPRLWPSAGVVLLVLAAGIARQSLQPVSDPARRDRARRMSAERIDLVRDLAALRGPVFSESPELLVMGGRRPFMIDPFALRVVTLKRPDVLGDVVGKLQARSFPAVVLMYDPDSAAGRGWYTNMDLGWPITSAILDNYELAGLKAGFRVYRPRTPVAGVTAAAAPTVESKRGTSAPNRP
jgi:hypothetical protein